MLYRLWSPTQGTAQGQAPFPALELQPRPVDRGLPPLGVDLRLGRHSKGHGLAFRIEPAARRIVVIDHRPGQSGVVIGLEQETFAPEVVLESVMKVQVIPGQIGEDGHRKAAAVGPVQREGMGGDLHHAPAAAGFDGLAQNGLDVDGFRRSSLRGPVPAVETRSQGPHHQSRFPLAQDGVHQRCGRGLPVGPGNSDQPQPGRRASEEMIGGAGHEAPDTGHLDPGKGAIGRSRPLGGHGDRAPFQRLIQVEMSVALEPPDGEEKASGSRMPGVVSQRLDLRVARLSGGSHERPDSLGREQAAESHRWSFPHRPNGPDTSIRGTREYRASDAAPQPCRCR